MIKSKAEWKFLAVNHPEALHKMQQDKPVVYSQLPEHVPVKQRDYRPKAKAPRVPPSAPRPSRRLSARRTDHHPRRSLQGSQASR